jgi:hypothetical protein
MSLQRGFVLRRLDALPLFELAGEVFQSGVHDFQSSVSDGVQFAIGA